MLNSVTFGVITAFAVAVVAVQYLRGSFYSRQTTSHHRPRSDPDITHVPSLGNCSHCHGSVNALNGYLLPCHHPLHYKCAADVKRILDNSTMLLCEICLGSNLRQPREDSSNGLRNRGSKYEKCVNCNRDIARNSHTLSCSHKVHETCWRRMQEASKPCASCHEAD